ncbi:hypothetical protein CPAV1605_524 [seawater metagenome]|uniref:Uncharacterized protein n=1 Tax=seawater metagenome TaxID=1561972 RepID=A0A5E8CJK4_9ZZZZ
MKTPLSIKKLKKEIDKTNILLLECYSEIKKEISKHYETETKNMLASIAEDYDIDLAELENKYLKKSKKKKGKKKDNAKEKTALENSLIECSSDDENGDQKKMPESNDLMTKAIVNDTECYYETKEGGAIYNKSLQKIGEFKNGKLNIF